MTFNPLALQNATGSVIVLCAQDVSASTVSPQTEATATEPLINLTDFMTIPRLRE